MSLLIMAFSSRSVDGGGRDCVSAVVARLLAGDAVPVELAAGDVGVVAAFAVPASSGGCADHDGSGRSGSSAADAVACVPW